MTTAPLARALRHLAIAAAALSSLAMSMHAACAADIPLYPTGPAEDSSFVRFVSGAAQPVDVTASGSSARLTLDSTKPASPFLPIAAGKPITGTLTRGGAHQAVSATVQPGEFVSIVALEGKGQGGAIRAVTVREKPDDFNALKASVAFYDLDAQCTAPALTVAGRDIVLLDGVALDKVKRRQVNPVALSVQLRCAGQAMGAPLSLGTLVAGQRYTVFLVPAGTHSRIFFANDAVGH